jgi:hypothetical protein
MFLGTVMKKIARYTTRAKEQELQLFFFLLFYYNYYQL